MSFSVLLWRILSLFNVILSILRHVLSIVPVHSDVPEDCRVVVGSSSSPDTQHPTTKESPELLGWTDAQIKVLQKLGGCSERNPSTRANDEGTHSDVSTPKHRIKIENDEGTHSDVSTPKHRIEIDDEQLLKAPYRGITTPMKNPNFLYQKVWNPVIDWNEWDVPWDRVSGYMFDQGTVWLYTRHDHELFIENHTPHIQFHAEDWAYFRNTICKELTSVEKCMEGAYIAQWNGS